MGHNVYAYPGLCAGLGTPRAVSRPLRRKRTVARSPCASPERNVEADTNDVACIALDFTGDSR